MNQEMTQILLPDSQKERPLVFYLSMEEYIADNFHSLFPDSSSCGTQKKCSTSSGYSRPSNTPGAFFIWQVAPTVIFGRNQDMNAEVNVPYCLSNGIRMFRRKSGGGCVYSDWGNVMISYIKPCQDGVQSLFSEYIDSLNSFLLSLGLPAEVSGRNDVLVGGRKVSGNAFSLRSDGVGIVHGTLLYDLDFSVMSSALTPSRAKLESKGVKSVEQRVLNLKGMLSEGKNIDLDGLKSAIISYFCKDELTLSSRDVEEISRIEKTYLDPVFIGGRHGVSDDSL